jgi:chemotaxis protein MotB
MNMAFKMKRNLALLFAAALCSGCFVAKSDYLAKEQEALKYKSDMDEIQHRYSKLKKRFGDLREENSIINRKGEEISARLDKTRIEIDRKDKHIDTLEAERKILKETLSAKSDTLSKTVAELIGKLDSMAVESTYLQKELEGHKELVALRDAEIKGLRRKFDTKAGKLKADLDIRQKQAEEIKQKLVATKTKLADLEKKSAAYKEMSKQLSEEIKKGQITISELKGKLTVNVLNQIMFDSGSVVIKKSGLNVLRKVSKVLNDIRDKDIRIEGHTDSDKIFGSLKKKYPTNWELSTARATRVVRFLVEKTGLDPANISAVGYGEFRPVVSNDTPQGKAKNRRIEIVLEPR